MKKVVAILLTLCIALTAVCALAEEPALKEINWSDLEQQVAEAGMQGGFVTFDEIALQMWVPDVMPAVELTEEDQEMGFISYFMTADESAAVGVQYVDASGMSLEDYAAQMEQNGATELEYILLNGLHTLTYSMPDSDAACVAFATEAGYILNFTLAPVSDENVAAMATIMMASIQATE